MTGGQIRFDTGPLGDGTLFRAPQAIIRADSAAGVGPALAAMQAATERVAGWRGICPTNWVTR
ncbi:hypothetical protein FLP41_07630 [Paracoccus marcusii]|uniref:hypothetical protein n=1 Tax=Paracoccus marcusii TaxID=59779 RepID=UPI002ED54CB1|nr:hypothetical protein FLP41_07630 [Paracoccus marcusii]